MTCLPRVFRLRQTFPRPRVHDPAAEVHAQLARLRLDEVVRPGQSVAISAGSRGIANITEITRAIVDHVRSLGAEPFVVPAMGSHGGGTADGQRRVIESYGLTEASLGCPIRSSIDTVVVCQTKEGLPVHFDREAFEADHVIVCNRIKPHTMFAGEIESGLMKMMLIGLGNPTGARIYHRAIEDFSFDQIVRSVATEVIAKCRVVAGVAIVENAYDETARVEAVRPKAMESREKELLRLAKQWITQLPFRYVDLLLIDRIGKEISGVGFDVNVVGRKFVDHRAAADEFPKVKRIALRGLTPDSHGNAVGVGLAEFCRSSLLRQMDVRATRLNAVTSGHVTAAMLPLDFETDREMIDVALRTVGLVEPQQARLLWIADTMKLDKLECSEAYLDEARGRDDLQILTEPRELQFDEKGNLAGCWA